MQGTGLTVMGRFAMWLLIVALLWGSASSLAPARQAAPQKPPKTEERSPATVSREIRHQLLVLPYYSVFDFLSFTLDGATVTLSGQVVRPNLKAQAEAAVKSLEGVNKVINQIEVLPASAADDELRRAVYRAIYEDAALERYAVQPVPSIRIIVNSGRVALEGFVNSASDKNLTALRVNGVPEVLVLRNNLVVSPKGSAPEQNFQSGTAPREK
jgi:hyperosmotically inducible protein